MVFTDEFKKKIRKAYFVATFFDSIEAKAFIKVLNENDGICQGEIAEKMYPTDETNNFRLKWSEYKQARGSQALARFKRAGYVEIEKRGKFRHISYSERIFEKIEIINKFDK